MSTTARPSVQHEDERVRVTRWDFEPGQSTGRHLHEHDYVVVPITDGQAEVIAPDGTSTSSHLRTGEAYARSAGVEHEIVNSGSLPLAFVEIEVMQK